LLPFGWMLRLSRWYTRKPKLVGFSALALLILGLSAGAVITGFTHGFWPNLLLNAAGDMLGGMVILLMIEPIVSRAAVQIRQHAHLDFRLFARRIPQAEREIRVLDTYSGLFDTTNGLRSLPALHDAVLRGVHVKVLLMSPATDASRLRQEQLEASYPGLSIDGQIHNNISALGTMEQQLAQALRRIGAPPPIPMIGSDSEDTGVYPVRPAEPAAAVQPAAAVGAFELRLYSVAAPFTLYQRDDTVLFALLPAYQFAHEAPQLEIAAGSLTGMQILEKFDELWEDARPVRRLAPIRLSHAEDTEPMWVRYLELGEEKYYISSRIDAALRIKPDQHFWLGEHGGDEHEAEPVPSDSTLHRQLLEAHDRKYSAERRGAPTFYQMWPSSEQPVPRGRTLDFDRLPTAQILQRLAGAERSVRLLDTSSNLIGQDGDAAGAEAFVQAALRAMANGATIRVLLLAPTTSAARERAKEIRDTHFDQMVERNIQRLRFLASQLPSRGIEPERLRVRLYDQLPEISLHQIDDRVLVGFLPYRRRSSMTSQLETERHSELGVYAVGQFEQIWTRARPLDGLRYVILRNQGTMVQGERLLVRAWQVGRTWHVASARIEELVAASGPRHPVHAWIEEAPGARFWLSEPLIRDESVPVWDAFARLYGAADPGVPVRALDLVE